MAKTPEDLLAGVSDTGPAMGENPIAATTGVLAGRKKELADLKKTTNTRSALGQATSAGGLTTAGLAAIALLMGESEAAGALALGGVSGAFQGADKYNSQQEAALQQATDKVEKAEDTDLAEKWDLMKKQPGVVMGSMQGEQAFYNFLGLGDADEKGTAFIGNYTTRVSRQQDLATAKEMEAEVKNIPTKEGRMVQWRRIQELRGYAADDVTLNNLASGVYTMDDFNKMLPFIDIDSLNAANRAANAYDQMMVEKGMAPDPDARAQIMQNAVTFAGDAASRKANHERLDKRMESRYKADVFRFMQTNGVSFFEASDAVSGALSPEERGMLETLDPGWLSTMEDELTNNMAIQTVLQSSLVQWGTENRKALQLYRSEQEAREHDAWNDIPAMSADLMGNLSHTWSGYLKGAQDGQNILQYAGSMTKVAEGMMGKSMSDMDESERDMVHGETSMMFSDAMVLRGQMLNSEDPEVRLRTEMQSPAAFFSRFVDQRVANKGPEDASIAEVLGSFEEEAGKVIEQNTGAEETVAPVAAIPEPVGKTMARGFGSAEAVATDARLREAARDEALKEQVKQDYAGLIEEMKTNHQGTYSSELTDDVDANYEILIDRISASNADTLGKNSNAVQLRELAERKYKQGLNAAVFKAPKEKGKSIHDMTVKEQYLFIAEILRVDKKIGK